jgi:hypothetical protein
MVAHDKDEEESERECRVTVLEPRRRPVSEDARVVEGTIMNGRCLRVGEEFLALVDY